MPMIHTDPIEAAAAALAAVDRAARDVAAEADYCAGAYPSWTMPTSLLIKLDEYREKAAMLFPAFEAAQEQHGYMRRKQTLNSTAAHLEMQRRGRGASA